jgi:threonine/homoserine/homoserine lactone efflux protein
MPIEWPSGRPSSPLQHGPRDALVASLGSMLAIACIMVLSMLGLGTVLAASETLFSILKWLGAAYLAYLGATSLLSKASNIAVPEETQPQVSARTLFGRGILVGASNPKALSAAAPRSMRLGSPRQQVGKLIRMLLFYRQNRFEQVAGGGVVGA